MEMCVGIGGIARARAMPPNNNNSHDNVYDAVIVTVHPVHLMTVARVLGKCS